MPEWPDLHVAQGRLERALPSRAVTAVTVGDPVVIRATRPLEELLVGRIFRSVRHRGKFLLFDLDGAAIVVNPMLSGLFELRPQGARVSKDTRLRLALDDGTELRYRDDTRMGKVYVFQEEAPEAAVPGLAGIGPDAPRIGDAEFLARARKRGGQVRNLLQDQRVASGIGNAYADEILWDAQLHPKRAVRSLSGEESAALYAAMQHVLARAVDEVEAGTPPELGVKVRAHLKVGGRSGTPCPRCGSTIRRTRKGHDETDYCPACQPAPPGQLL